MKCGICNTNIENPTKTQKYCGYECRKIVAKNLSKRNYKPKIIDQKKCIICKKEFQPKKNSRELCYDKNCRKNNKEKFLENARKYSKAHPNKLKARRIAQKIPLKEICEMCNKNKAKHRHHEDYDKPSEIDHLCIRCHGEKHIKNTLENIDFSLGGKQRGN